MVDLETTFSGRIRSQRQCRQSLHINRKPASNLYWAVRVAEALGLPLTHFVTLNFSLTQCPRETASSAFERLRDNYFGPWTRRPPKRTGARSCPPTFAWVIEAAGDQLAAHWLLHVPPDRLTDFRLRLPRWLTAVAGEIQPAAVHIVSAHAPKGAARYMLKGIDPIYARFYGVRHEPQGLVHGKRSGFSRNLGPSRKEALGLKPKWRYSEQQARAIASQAAP